ncbi:EAL domain-containing protein [Colwellia sp. MB02u-18]|uniref:EAL domain-containing protein n=1 Tax=unclassified Colwellia TaxID=196834 RepID=UPI0015F6E004|nr:MULTISPECIES: EAL domain-containing protein [unclassified Colwellia]MBA6224444.1 EAL domain-containing protein [Colwellia sp. MB3u-45]MBA6267686.1 EAL domain-containing protein [Colwellia sp. MB3u-43]MBA6322138.1 EAL domain-containing protein [Colwellia sp. MB02u-19]MBA6326274.1 EAL domain-containing protein [Colwellia sp. MB02u-18]MBA6331733.1 EAL domain-containing protein [Colwellia sp. MB02u-12]
MSVLSKSQTIKSLIITNQFATDILLLNTPNEIWQYLAQNIVEKLGFDDAVIYTLDAGGETLSRMSGFEKKTSFNHDKSSNVEIKNTSSNSIVIPFNEGVIGKVAATKQALLVKDIRKFEGYIVEDETTLSELAVPILFKEQLLGVIDSEHARVDFYTEYHLRTLTALASLTAMKISQIIKVDGLEEVIENLEYANKIQDALFEIAELTFTTSTMGDFYRSLHQCIGRITFAKNFFVALLKDDGKTIEFPYAVDELDQDIVDELDQGKIFDKVAIDPQHLSITGYALLKDKPFLLYEKDIQKMLDNKELYILGSIAKAWLGVPFGRGDNKGIVVVQSYSTDFLFQEKDKQLLSFVAKHIHNAIERMAAQQKLQFLALHDPLTDLPNRSLFKDRMQHAFLHCQNNRQDNLAILFIDVDRFKQVNDTYGHHVGDKLLIAIVKSITTTLRNTDTLARLGGDEFAILLDGKIDYETICRVTESIIEATSGAFTIDGLNISSSVSIGIATYSDASESADQLLIDADHAMYQAKLKGRNQYVFFEALEEQNKSTNVKVEYDFEHGVKNLEFIGNYQPLIDFDTGDVIGAEILVRWQHPKLGLLFPDIFIPILERSGQIVQLDLYMLKLAVNNLKLWADWLPEKFKLNVNVSTSGFASQDFINYLQEQHLESAGVTERLCVEITEASLILNADAVKKHLDILKSLNISVALDDFGTGFSSLSYLHQFSLNYLKIDKSFVDDINEVSSKVLILDAVVNLAKALKIKTTAEGIETKAQYQKLKEIGCDLGQGYYIAKPLLDTDFKRFLLNRGY